ncbi:hypothetical protein SFC88_14455 [Nocardioides sp. HM23]|uniref:hypothetical protein n=1 Tax=Nocardioides bizhenqiangii TaxID=3095076 RepID=UPI002ACABA65|nr:hypothetical protein [Nocardioides sp. HM23]MDZ5622046.1 hypothetical protein [Nocardioides sp. HM23]
MGEHVISHWFIKLFAGQGPFTSEKDGAPYLNRRGEVALQGSLPGVHIPMCSDCNNKLSQTIEADAKPVIERLLPWSSEHSWPTIDGAEAMALTKWLLKVGLLWAHPRSHHDQPQVRRDPNMARLEFVEPEWVAWMRTGDDPPEGFSVYVARRSPLADHAEWPDNKRERIALPSRVVVGHQQLRFMTRNFGIRGLDVTIVWHPGWPIVHPLVAEGRAAAIWPDPQPVAFSGLRDVHPKEVTFFMSGVMVATNEDEYSRGAPLHPLGVGVLPALADLSE